MHAALSTLALGQLHVQQDMQDPQMKAFFCCLKSNTVQKEAVLKPGCVPAENDAHERRGACILVPCAGRRALLGRALRTAEGPGHAPAPAAGCAAPAGACTCHVRFVSHVHMCGCGVCHFRSLSSSRCMEAVHVADAMAATQEPCSSSFVFTHPSQIVPGDP